MNGQIKVMKQISFDEAVMEENVAKVERLGDFVDKCIRIVGNQMDREKLSALLNSKYTTVCGWLNTNSRDRTHPVDALGAYIVEIPDVLIRDFISPICDLCGYDAPAKKSPPDPEKQLKEIKNKLELLKLNDHPDFKEFFK